MKSRKRKHILLWILGIFLFLSIPLAFVGKGAVNDMRARVGRNKTLIDNMVADNYAHKSIDDQILDNSRNQVHNVFSEVEKKMGKFVSVGTPDTIPSFADLFSNGAELSYNLPAQFEKGYVTFIFRVKNDDLNQQVIWLESADGVLPHDDFKRRLRSHLP
ncbi:MAG: hypothetical protein JST12_13945 [Armatimonadetes bacterium]|nr:hypothetical protein [Armatimonadota bacterium]MBS1702761.1 hypothetical protein [Armatimonadota bacterium]MBS1727571.1 hypothetical protein [Armatimonadota bacterium]